MVTLKVLGNLVTVPLRYMFYVIRCINGVIRINLPIYKCTGSQLTIISQLIKTRRLRTSPIKLEYMLRSAQSPLYLVYFFMFRDLRYDLCFTSILRNLSILGLILTIQCNYHAVGLHTLPAQEFILSPIILFTN